MTNEQLEKWIKELVVEGRSRDMTSQRTRIVWDRQLFLQRISCNWEIEKYKKILC